MFRREPCATKHHGSVVRSRCLEALGRMPPTWSDQNDSSHTRNCLLSFVAGFPTDKRQSRPLKDLVKLSIVGNAVAAKLALKGAAALTKKSIAFNAKVAGCAIKVLGKKPC